MTRPDQIRLQRQIHDDLGVALMQFSLSFNVLASACMMSSSRIKIPTLANPAGPARWTGDWDEEASANPAQNGRCLFASIPHPRCPPARPDGLETGTKRRRPVRPRMADAISSQSPVGRLPDSIRTSANPAPNWPTVGGAMLAPVRRPVWARMADRRSRHSKKWLGRQLWAPWADGCLPRGVFRMLRTSVGHSGPDWPTAGG